MPDDSDEEEFVYSGTSSDNQETFTVTERRPQTTSTTQLETEANEEEFVYPGASTNESTPEAAKLRVAKPPEQQSHSEPGLSSLSEISLPVETSPVHDHITPPKAQPSPVQLEAIHSAAASGDLRGLQGRFKDIRKAGDFEPFALANDASPRTGLTALHAASSRGHLHIVKWRTPFSLCNF